MKKVDAPRDSDVSQARGDKEVPPSRQDVAIEAFARGIQVGFKRGLSAAKKKGQAPDIAIANRQFPYNPKPARPLLTPPELSMLSWLRDHRDGG